MGYRRSWLTRVCAAGFRAVERVIPWHRLPRLLGLLGLWLFRDELRERNLFDTAGADAIGPRPPPFDAAAATARTCEGHDNDLSQRTMGMAGAPFGRNMPPSAVRLETAPGLLDPSPRLISQRLLARRDFIPARTLNVLAAAWIQFQVHDWVRHASAPRDQDLTLPLPPDDPWPERPMRVPRSAAAGPDTFGNTETHWWDASAIYGSSTASARQLRTFAGGMLTAHEGRLPRDPQTGMSLTGFEHNWWLGLGVLHTLFTQEHNAISARLARAYPDWADERLYQTARLINSALIAKIHTLEWTLAILDHPAVRLAMRGNWWGLASERLARLAGRISDSEVISGIPGSPTDHHGVPFSLTEEFVSVYRLHPLIPDDYVLHAVDSGRVVRRVQFPDIALTKAADLLSSGSGLTTADICYSFGIAHPGAIALHNYPRFLRDLTTDEGVRLDLAAVDILRDRERGVPRYNQFRELVHKPPLRSFDELTRNRVWAAELREIYGDRLDRVDLMVGLFAEDLPRGFGFSDTAFRLFILMASRRLKSDRFFTTDYTPRLYTQVGLDWINDNTLSSVLLRHYPELAPALAGVDNAFAPWRRLPTAPA